ncbi:MAG: M24 family metallopeptidase [Acidimicrobiales bacterium]
MGYPFPMPLEPTELPLRLGRLRAALEAQGIEALAVTSVVNIRYLCGFSGSSATLFVLPGETVLVTDGRYRTQAAEELAGAGVPVRALVPTPADQRQAVGALVAGAGVPALALEAAHLSWARQRDLAERWFEGVDLVPTVGVVEGLRRRKDAGELARMAAAARIADDAFAAVRPTLAGAPTEAGFALALDDEMRRRGAEGPAFETICASGPLAALPHHRPGQRRIGPGETVVVDFGAAVDGYRSDMTRTVWFGHLDDPVLARAWEVVEASQAAGVGAVRAGASGVDVDHACRQVIDAAGWKDSFVHGTGHGVGLDIHEAPAIALTSTDTLAAGDVVTVEPGIYITGAGGVRIEDTVVVTDYGCVPLTKTPKDRPHP